MLGSVVMIGAVLLLASCGGEDAAAAPVAPNPFDAKYSVSGRLVTAAGAPLPGATATLQGSSMNGADFMGMDALADAEGRYQFQAIPVGIYTVRPSMPGYLFLVGGWSNIRVRDGDVVLPEIAAVVGP